MSEPFRISVDSLGNAVVIGHGIVLPATASGHAIMTIDMLEQLYRVAKLEAALPGDDGEQLVASHERRKRERIEAAKSDIMERFGFDNTDLEGKPL